MNSSITQSQATASTLTTIQDWMVQQIADVLSLDVAAIDVNQSLTRYGLDSIDAVTLVADLEDWLEQELPSTLFWDYPTIAKAATYLVNEFEVSTVPSDG